MEDIQKLTNRINELATAYRQSCVLFAAFNAGLFAELEEMRTAEEVARRMEWDPRGARILLDTLYALGLVARSPAGYRNEPVASMCLVPGAPAYQGNIVRHLQGGWPTWARLLEAVRSGDAVSGPESERSPEELRNFILGMQDIARFSARQVLDAVDFGAYRRLLDLGGGPATHSIAFLERYPEMRATLFDRPEVLDIAREQVGRAGFEDRFAYRGGDFMTDDIGAGYDLILLSNIIHSYGYDRNQALVRKCFDALAPGGRLVIKDFLTDPERSGPPFSLFFALHMLIHTGEGDTYPAAEVQEWTNAAGFGPGRLIDVTPQSRLWIADRP